MICKDCKHFLKIENTESTRQGLCTYFDYLSPVIIDQNCVYLKGPYTCKDCARFGKDFACMTCEAEDKSCSAFIDKYEEIVERALFDWKMRGFNIKEKVIDIVDHFEKTFKEF